MDLRAAGAQAHTGDPGLARSRRAVHQPGLIKIVVQQACVHTRLV